MKRWKVYVLCAMCVLGISLLTGCGNREKNGTGTLNNERTEENRVTDRVNEGVNDATGDDAEDNNSGIGDAVEDLADGVGNAGEDIVDGVEDAGDSLLGDDKTEQSDNQSENTNTAGNQ